LNRLSNLPNVLTLSRIATIPVLVAVFYLPFSWAHMVAAIFFATASFTDWLDGFLARKLKQTSPFGAFLDPVADKLLISTSLLLLLGEHNLHYITLPAIVIVGREIVISALREWMAEFGARASLAVSYMGKIKTVIQMLAVFLLLAFHPAQSTWGIIGFILLYVAAILTIWSMVLYMIMAWPQLIQKSPEE